MTQENDGRSIEASFSSLSIYDQAHVLQYWPQYYDPDVYERFAHVRAQLAYYASEFHYQNKIYRTGPYFKEECTYAKFALIKVHNKKTFDDYENTFRQEPRGVQFRCARRSILRGLSFMLP